MKETTIALIGLAGTIVTAGLAYLQFQRSQRSAAREKNRDRTQAISEEIWKHTETIAQLLRNQWDDREMKRGGKFWKTSGN